jgi:hypothetical protein
MMHSASASGLGAEFDEFLFAPIADDSNGMLLSVVSALARLDVDPWEEAAELARLPVDTATERLRALIAVLPHGISASSDPAAIAARLIALLPRRTTSQTRSRERLLGTQTATQSQAIKYLIWYVIFTGFVLGQWIVASHHPPTQAGNASTPAPSTVPSPMLPRNSAQ